MPAGYVRAWVYKNHDSYPYLQKTPGWQFIPVGDLIALTTAGCVERVGTVPQRYLSMPDNTPAAAAVAAAVATGGP